MTNKNKKSTIKYKKKSPMNYQMGGFPGLDYITNLNNHWGNFWKGGNYDGLQGGPSNPLLVDTVRQNDAAIAGKKNVQDYANRTGAVEWGDKALDYTYRNDWNNRNPNATDADKARFDNYSGFFSQYENGKATPGWNGVPTLEAGAPGSTLGDYNAWKDARAGIADQAKKEWANNNMSYNEMNKDANKAAGAAMTNSAAGLFSGLNYQNAYKEPEAINLQQGFQGVEYAQYGTNVGPNVSNYLVTSENPDKTISAFQGPIADKINFQGRGTPLPSEFESIIANNDVLESLVGLQGLGKSGLKKLTKNKIISLLTKNAPHAGATAAQQVAQERAASWQYGGKMNLTGYTPGTPTIGNKINTIPGGNISMSNTPFPIVGIGKDGLTKIMQPGQQYSFGYNDNVNELPLQQFGGNMRLPYMQLGAEVNMAERLSDPSNNYLGENDLYTYLKKGDNNYTRIHKKTNKQDTFDQEGIERAFQEDPLWTNPAITPGTTNTQQNNPTSSNMIGGRMALGQTDYPVPQFGIPGFAEATSPRIPYSPGTGMNPTNTIAPRFTLDPSTGNTYAMDDNLDGYGTPTGLNNQSSNSASNFKNEVYSLKGDRTYEYSKDPNGNWLTRKKGGTGSWTNINNTQDSEKFNKSKAIDKLNKNAVLGNITPIKTKSGGIRKSIARVENNNGSNVPTTFTPNPSTYQRGIRNDYTFFAAKDNIKDFNNISKNYKFKNEKDFNSYSEQLAGSIDRGLITPYEAMRLQKLAEKKGYYTPNKQYGGYIQLPKFQFGGEINNDHTYPIHPITEEFMEIQTEYGETIMLPDGTIVNVKASDKHKHMDKDEVTDILPEGAYVFSADPKMKFSVNSKIGTTKVEDMNLGQSVFEYKENEITPGPEKIYVKDVFFGNSKKELTTAEISNNIKKKFELRDDKHDFFVDRAVTENKEQRVEYLSILKAMNEFKKPKSKREVPQAQYGMNVSSMLPMQSTNNALDGVMGYSNRAMDPFKRMDNTKLNQFNAPFKQPSLPTIPKMYGEGGNVPHAQLGKLLRYTSPGAYFASEYFAKKAGKKQDQVNQEEMRQWDSLTNDYMDNVNRTGTIDQATNLATYMASLNVPKQAYDNMSQQSALQNEGYNRQRAILNADKYSAQNTLGAGTSMARFAGNNQNLGQYLAASQQGYNQQVSGINGQLAQLEGNNTAARMDLTSQGNNNYNNMLNAFNSQVYNANVTGIGNVGRSIGTANANLGNAKYATGQERLALLRQQRDAASAAKQKVTGDWEGALGSAGQVAMMAAGVPGGLGGGQQQTSQGQVNNENPYGFDGTKGYDMSNYTSNPYNYQAPMMQPIMTQTPLQYNTWSMMQTSPANQQFAPDPRSAHDISLGTRLNSGNPYSGYNFNNYRTWQ
jgi:hypothetical protein